MATYLGIQTQINRNNRMTVIYLLAFPLLILCTIYAYMLLFFAEEGKELDINLVNNSYIFIAPWAAGAILIWFLIAYMSHSKMIDSATNAMTLDRKNNLRVFNLIENLCMTEGMTMPKVHVIEDPALNAFASGISEKSYTITLSRGIIDNLTDDELQGVIAHELMHIRNRDVRLLVVTVIFVGIFSFIMQSMLRGTYFREREKSKKDSRTNMLALVVAAVAYLLAILFKLGLSRKREYAADAGAADMIRNPKALASALRKISANYQLKAVKNDDVKEMLIHNYSDKSLGFRGAIEGFFSTHPPIESRIRVLEEF